MFVTPVTVLQKAELTTFSADFIFARPRPTGGKQALILFWLQFVQALITHPRQILKSGWQVRKRVWFTVPAKNATSDRSSDAFFMLALPLAIALKEDLVFSDPISKEALEKSEAIHKYYHEISKRKTLITVPTRNSNFAKQNQLGQFFTLGVDSFYSLCCAAEQNLNRQLIYVDGYDVPFYEKKFLNEIHQRIENVAQQTSTAAVFVDTNLREVANGIIGWGRYHVSSLVAVATLLNLNRILINGESFDSDDWGLRSGIDRLYSTPNLQVELVAHTVERHQKIRELVESKYRRLFLNNVRVCWENVLLPDLPYNCSKCQKCIKAQLSLLLLKVKETPTFLPLDLVALEKVHLVGHVFPEWQHLYLEFKKEADTDPALLFALQKVIEKPIRV